MENELREYFDNRVISKPENTCWRWFGSIHRWNGYGIVIFHGKKIPAHRVSWILYKGELLDNETVYHKCENRHCVNPDHLYKEIDVFTKNCFLCNKEYQCRKDKLETSKYCSKHCLLTAAGRISREKQLATWNSQSLLEVKQEMQIALERFFNKNDGCWNWIGAKRVGNRLPYGKFTFRGKNYNAHKAAWLVYKGEMPEDKLVLHTCDNASCVNPDHLYLGTALDNQRDKLKRGRCKVEKLTIEQVKEIREAFRNGVRSDYLANKYGVSNVTIHNIKYRKTWKDID